MTFATERELTDHGRMHIGGAGADFKCAACGGTFRSQAERKQHNATAHRM
jgi:hypothetical protein